MYIEHNYREKKTKSITTCSVVQLTMTTQGAHSQGSVFVRKCADWLHCRLETHNCLCKGPSTVGGILQT